MNNKKLRIYLYKSLSECDNQKLILDIDDNETMDKTESIINKVKTNPEITKIIVRELLNG